MPRSAPRLIKTTSFVISSWVAIGLLTLLWNFFRPGQQVSWLLPAGLAAAVLLLVLLWELPKDQVARLGKDSGESKGPFELENEVRRTIAQIIGGLVVLVGLYFSWQQLVVSQRGQVTDRFTKAIDQLGKKNEDEIVLRLGGIFSLKRLAEDSREVREPAIDVLSGFVRTRVKKGASEGYKSGTAPKPDIQTALNAIGDLIQRFPDPARRLDLSGTDLRGATLAGFPLNNTNLNDSDLSGANLRNISLRSATLINSILQSVDLQGGHLNREGDLKGADLRYAHLQGAQLVGADLRGANMEGCDLRDLPEVQTHLDRVQVDGTTVLDDCHVEGIDLSSVHGLTTKQWSRLKKDAETTSPREPLIP